VGKIVGTHGIKGVIKVYSYAESLAIYKAGRFLATRTPDGYWKRYKILWAKPHKKVILLSLSEICDINLAKTLAGAEIFIKKDVLPDLEDGTYYWFDLIGLDVYSACNNYLGQINSIIPTGSNDVYVVRNSSKLQNTEVLVPAIESVVKSIDLKSKIMRVDLPEGL